ncbi:MAG: LexA repressor [SAR116 cluster bacterium MED-G04]|jgi:DNA polymerase V|nr:MAG: LexA repressor [SAR116 cluster bacterium MED-G04]|tara:strand:+ start:202 stop:753 length:552 start_codon:yes stop_codon:yes gene_type:complete
MMPKETTPKTQKGRRGGARPGAGRPKGQGPYGEATKPVRIPLSKIDQVLQFIRKGDMQLPLFSCAVAAGFPSPADDHLEGSLDLNEYLINKPAATFFVRVSGDSMIKAGIHEDDILVVDRSIEPRQGRIVIAAVEGQLTVKRLDRKGGQTRLMPENDSYSPIVIADDNDMVIWGVVTSVIHKV